MKVVLSSNPYRDRGMKAALEAKKILERENIDAVLCLSFTPRKGERVDIPHGISVSSLDKELPGADVLVCFGGDGTILHAARDATSHNVPVLGVNLGSVGFMAELERTELSLLSLLGKGSHRTEERMMLDIRVLRGGRVISEDLALNDAVISNGSMARVAQLEVLADGEVVTEVTGDGVIIATPTGSTAYSMSAGGPIVEPTSSCVLITPVCPHQLSARPIVLGAERKVSVQLPRNSRKQLFLSVDGGKAVRLSGGDRVEVSRSSRTTRLIRLSERSFYQIIRQKLGGFVP